MSSLLVIDMQNDFVSKDGSLCVQGAQGIVPKINQIRDKFKHVMWTQDWHPSNHVSFVTSHPGHKLYDVVDTGVYKQVLFMPHCVQNTEGAKLNPELVVKDDDLFVVKGCNPDIDSYSCFFDIERRNHTNAKEQLDRINVNTLYVLGVATDYCVKSSVLDALELGYCVYVIEDCIAAVNPDDSPKAIEEMKEKGALMIKSNEIPDKNYL